jgi:leucyl/phenylalanyl-tRNA--protein transferase
MRPASPRFFCFADESYVDHLPPPNRALRDPDGLLAAGGDLEPTTLMGAYQRGIFPWYSNGQPVLWWAPDPRTVFWPGEFHVSRSLARTLRRGVYTVSLDRAFPAVIAACGPGRKADAETWITPAMVRAYTRLHTAGYAHSVECWRDGTLVGGVYGVALGSVFFGESMFSIATDASKVALALLCQALASWGYAVFDCQMASQHLSSLGAVELPRSRFNALLEEHVARPPASQAWQEFVETTVV